MELIFEIFFEVYIELMMCIVPEEKASLKRYRGLETEKNYYGEIVYGKRSKLTLGVRVSSGE